MGRLNVFSVVMTLVFHLSMHANKAGRILHGVEQELMNKNLVNQRAIVGDASLPGMLQRVQSNHLRLIHRLMTVLQIAKALLWVTIYKAH